MIGLDLGVSFVRRFITGIFWSFPPFPIIIEFVSFSHFVLGCKFEFDLFSY